MAPILTVQGQPGPVHARTSAWELTLVRVGRAGDAPVHRNGHLGNQGRRRGKLEIEEIRRRGTLLVVPAQGREAGTLVIEADLVLDPLLQEVRG